MEDDLPAPEGGLFALYYAAGHRPSLVDVCRAAEASGVFAVTFDPGADAGWAELLITGLGFDVAGLAPGSAEPMPPVAHRFGLADTWPDVALESVVIRPGAHLAGAAAMLPVVRGAAALAAELASQTRAAAVAWIPARSAMGTDYFGAAIAEWLGGGAFPALGLTALVPNAVGLESEGLRFFTGAELEVVAAPDGDLVRAGRVAVRMIHQLVSHGPLTATTRLTGPDGELLLAEPVDGGSTVRIGLDR